MKTFEHYEKKMKGKYPDNYNWKVAMELMVNDHAQKIEALEKRLETMEKLNKIPPSTL